MKYVHIMNEEKFTLPFIEMINGNFDSKEHCFIITGNNSYIDKQNNKIKNLMFLGDSNSEFKELKLLFESSDQILIHGFFQDFKFKLFMLKNYFLLNKCNWIIWGGDIYSSTMNYGIKSKIDSNLKKILVKKFGYVSTLVKSDYNVAKEKYEVKGEYLRAMYLTPIKIEFLNRLDKKKINNIINIQIGNSADSSNLHIEAIDILAKYSNEDVCIYCPLSYGDKEYANKVIKYGKEVFGQKFVGITSYMDGEQYGEFLASIDVAIFNNNRQQALGNIFALSYLGKKIFMRNDTTMWNDLVENEGYKFSSVDEIELNNFNQFINNSQCNILNNKELSRNRFDVNHIANVWKNIFNTSNK